MGESARAPELFGPRGSHRVQTWEVEAVGALVPLVGPSRVRCSAVAWRGDLPGALAHINLHVPAPAGDPFREVPFAASRDRAGDLRALAAELAAAYAAQ